MIRIYIQGGYPFTAGLHCRTELPSHHDTILQSFSEYANNYHLPRRKFPHKPIGCHPLADLTIKKCRVSLAGLPLIPCDQEPWYAIGHVTNQPCVNNLAVEYITGSWPPHTSSMLAWRGTPQNADTGNRSNEGSHYTALPRCTGVGGGGLSTPPHPPPQPGNQPAQYSTN